MKSSSEKRRRLRRPVLFLLRHTAALILLLLTAAICLMYTAGVPAPLLEELVRRADLPGVAVEAGHMRLAPGKGLVLSGVSVYRKRVIGPAVMTADKLEIGFSLLNRLRHGGFIKKVVLRRGVIRPEMLWLGRPERKVDPAAETRSFSLGVEVESCEIWGMHFAQIAGRVDYHPERLNVEIEQGCLQDAFELQRNLKGALNWHEESRVIDGRLICGFHPHALLTMLKALDMPFTASIVRDFEFDAAPPHIDAEFSVLTGTGRVDVAAQVRLPRCRFRGVDLLHADGLVTVSKTADDLRLSIDPLILVRPEGVASGMLGVAYADRNLVFNLKSGLAPPALFKMAGLKPDHVLLRRCRYDGPALITASGLLGLGANERDRFNFSYDGYGFGFDPLKTEHCRVDGYVEGMYYQATNVQVRICGGTAGGELSFVLPAESAEQLRYRADVNFKQVDFPGLMAQFSVDQLRETTGVIGGRFTVSGALGEDYMRTLEGGGAVQIRKGHVFRLPLFGGLSEALSRLVPGLDFVLRQSDADADFRFENGRIISRRVSAQGDVFSLEGSGRYDIVRDDLRYDVQVKLMKEHTLLAKILRTVTYPISRLLEFRLRGTLKEPHWYPVNFSGDLLRRLSNAPGQIMSVFSHEKEPE
jgi:hypothetical protein